MESVTDHSVEAVPATLDNELSMIRAAIAMVASGGAPRVVLSSLRFAEPLLATAREIAAGSGVRVEPLWTASEHPAAIAVERITP